MMKNQKEKATKTNSGIQIRKLTMTGMLSAVAFVLMFLNFNVPIMPSFIKMDLSELPALVGSFSMGPISGLTICFIKNLLHLAVTDTSGVGEFSNFILGALFVVPAGIIYNYKKTRIGAIAGSLIGAVLMAVVSVFTNYYIVYPVYTVMLPMEAIIGAYKAINPNVETLWDALIWFNMPFTFVKGMFSVLITLLVYKRLSPVIKGTRVQLHCK